MAGSSPPLHRLLPQRKGALNQLLAVVSVKQFVARQLMTVHLLGKRFLHRGVGRRAAGRLRRHDGLRAVFDEPGERVVVSVRYRIGPGVSRL